jgi:hypothetical protein
LRARESFARFSTTFARHHVLHLRDAQSHCSVRSAHRNSVASLSSARLILPSSTEPRMRSVEAVCKEIGGVRYMLKLLEVMRCAGGHVLCAVSAGGRCALCAGGCEGRAACAVGAGGCALLAGGCALRALYAGVSDRRATCACWKCKCWRLCSMLHA